MFVMCLKQWMLQSCHAVKFSVHHIITQFRIYSVKSYKLHLLV